MYVYKHIYIYIFTYIYDDDNHHDYYYHFDINRVIWPFTCLIFESYQRFIQLHQMIFNIEIRIINDSSQKIGNFQRRPYVINIMLLLIIKDEIDFMIA
jgi:hypothetical protein